MNRSATTSAPLRAAALAALALAVAACGREQAATTTTPTAQPATPATAGGAGLEGRLAIVARPGYVERGATDPRFDWTTSFEKETGCKVTVRTAGSSEEMVALVTQGGHDLVIAPGDAAQRLIRAGVVQALDLRRLPSHANLDPRLQQAPALVTAGRHYGTPFQWAPNVLLYSTRVFGSAPESWSVVFEDRRLPDGRYNKGRVQAYGGPLYVADAALFLMGSAPELGIADPYELTEPQYAAALELLRRQRPLVQRYWQDPNLQVQDFTAAAVAASGSWPFQANTLAANGQPVASTIPREGATGWIDAHLLAAKAAHPNCAYRWLEWSLNARVQGDVAAWMGSVPAVPAACQGNALLTDAGCDRNGSGAFERIRFWRLPVAECAQGACVPYERWAEDYAAIVAGR
jgi:putative spermidine/putrescine transport system substrate-binding protein